jgi:hypothetical protein
MLFVTKLALLASVFEENISPHLKKGLAYKKCFVLNHQKLGSIGSGKKVLFKFMTRCCKQNKFLRHSRLLPLGLESIL